MRNRIAAALALATLAISLFYAARRVPDWRQQYDLPRSDFEAFADEARARIPADARVKVVVPGENPRHHKLANLLSERLHPRLLVADGAADWEIELPAGDFDRAKAAIRKVSP